MALSGELLQLEAPSHTLFVVNPSANGGNCEMAFKQINGELELNDKKKFTIIETSNDKRDAGKVAAEWLRGADLDITPSPDRPFRIIAVGGDGTLSQILQEFHGREDIQVGVLPLGTLNDAASALNIKSTVMSDYQATIHSPYGASIGNYTITQCAEDGTPTKSSSIAWIDAVSGVALKTLESKQAADQSRDCLSCLPNTIETYCRAIKAIYWWQGLSIRVEGEQGKVLYSGKMGNLAVTSIGILGDLNISPQVVPQWFKNTELSGEVHITEHSGIFGNLYHLMKLTGKAHKDDAYTWSRGIPLKHNESVTVYCDDDNSENATIELENGTRFTYPIQITWRNNQATLVAGKPPADQLAKNAR